MKHGMVIAVLTTLFAVGCGLKPKPQLKVTYISDPPGGMLYKQNGELWGPCDKPLWYDLDENALDRGYLDVKGLMVRWPDGSEKKSGKLIRIPVDGTDQQFAFVQPEKETDAPHVSSSTEEERDVVIQIEPGQVQTLSEERNEEIAQITDTATTVDPNDAVIEKDAIVTQVESERDPGLHEEEGEEEEGRNEEIVQITDTAKTVDPNDVVIEKDAIVAQVESERDPGLHEEEEGCNEEDTQMADAAKTVDPNDTVMEKDAVVAQVESERDPELYEEEDREKMRITDMAETVDLADVATEEGIVQVKTAIKIVDFSNGMTMEFALIPADVFMINSPSDQEGNDPNASPMRKVRISNPFYMSVYEVTTEQYEKVMGTNPSRFKGPRRPVERVSWRDAQRFCRNLSDIDGGQYRLPTEAEWEYACRAGTTTAYYWGNDFDDGYAWAITNSKAVSHDVGTRLPNAWGLRDMAGNVAEWCQDWHGQYEPSPAEQIDPKGPSGGIYRVLRGGSWGQAPTNCQSAHCNPQTPNHIYDDCGIRVVLDLE